MEQENNELKIPELAIIELGNGVFDKPGVLGDLITSYANARVIIACENPNDIRFVESILTRRGVDIRRVSPIIDDQSVKSVATWFEGKTEGNIVCPLNVAETLCKTVTTQMLVLYNPTFTEGLAEITKSKNSETSTLPIVALVSPQELPAFLISSKSHGVSFSTFEVKKSLVAQKTFELLNNKLSKTKISTQIPIQEITNAIKNSDLTALAGTISQNQKVGSSEEIISKLLSFFVENSSTSNTSSIDEDLGLTTIKNEKFSESAANEDSREGDRKEGNRREPSSKNREPREDNRNRSRQESSDDRYSEDRRPSRSSYDEPNRSKYSQEVIRYRIYFGAGELDELNIPNLRALLYEYLPETSRINRVHIRDNYSFVDIDSSDLEHLIECIENIQLRGKLINTDIAEIIGPVDDDRNHRNNRRGRNDRQGGRGRDSRGGYGNRDGNRERNSRGRNNRRDNGRREHSSY